MDGGGGSGARQMSRNSEALQDASAVRNFHLNTFKEDEFRIALDRVVRTSDLGQDGKTSDLSALLNSELGSKNRRASLADLDLGHGDSVDKADDRTRGKHHDKDLDDDCDTLAVVATPEPGSGTLLLFGLTALVVIVYRRNGL